MNANIEIAIKNVEAEISAQKAVIDAVNVKVKPLQAELEALNAAVLKAQAAARDKAAEIQAARPADWLEIKRKYGQLCASRMQLRALKK